ncbi:hypothetical protein [Romboutsia sp.]
MDKSKIIERTSELLLNESKEAAINVINTEYKFKYKKIEKKI